MEGKNDWLWLRWMYSANMAEGGLKRLLKNEVPWIFMFWCLAHRLELSVKDALNSNLFSDIDELLLRMYYMYKKIIQEVP